VESAVLVNSSQRMILVQAGNMPVPPEKEELEKCQQKGYHTVGHKSYKIMLYYYITDFYVGVESGANLDLKSLKARMIFVKTS
jgi:hypothetical protein